MIPRAVITLLLYAANLIPVSLLCLNLYKPLFPFVLLLAPIAAWWLLERRGILRS